MKPPRRRACLALALFAAALTSRPAMGQERAVLCPDDQPRTMLYQALLKQARAQLAQRRKDVAALKTPAALQARAQRIRERFREALGELPERTPLNARVVGSLRRPGYTVERVIYESRPAHHVTANFYRPDGDGPFPGVLVPCGHSANGKAAEPYQRVCTLLASNGVAVLCFDPIGQGERVQALNADGKPAIVGSTTEHTMAGIGALLVGRSAAGYRVWDAMRSLDYLASRPEVDPKRLGCTGNSGGGTETAYMMALDERVAVAVPSCYITSLERLFATIGPQDAEQDITGQVAFGMDHADYVLMRAPKPTLLSVGTRDFFDIDGSWDTFREVKLAYGRFGFGERVDLFESDEPHGFTKPRREAAVRWLRRWLLHRDEPTTEQDAPAIPDAELQCTDTGQVLTALHGKSVFDLNAARANELREARSEYAAAHSKDERLAEVRRLIGLPATVAPAKREERKTASRGAQRLRKLVFTTEPGVIVPALLCEPAEGTTRRDDPGPKVVIGANAVPAAKFEPRALTIVVGAESGEDLVPGGLVDRVLKSGGAVLIADLRGMGETTPEGAASPFGADWKEAFLSLHLARPLLGQRVADVLAIVGALAGEYGEIALVGRGKAAPVALHAAALEPRIASLTLDGMVTSWSDVAQAVRSRDQLANAVPNALKIYDLPDLAALVLPRRLTLRPAVNPAGFPAPPERLAAEYAACRTAAAFKMVDGPPHPARTPLSRTLDLSVGETQQVTLADGKTASVKLIDVRETVDPIRSAVRAAVVKAEVNGAAVTLSSGNYHLPIAAGGVQVDCPVTRGYRANSGQDAWKLEKDARLRLWPARSPWIEPATFAYPLRQRWFASNTQMANEPVFVDGGEDPAVKKVYYHYGLDSGGAEGMADVVAATDGLVVSAGTSRLRGFDDSPAKPRYDVVYVLDGRGWFYRYSHLQTIDPAIRPGEPVRKGEPIGVLGKEGGSGGWSHLHFDITSRQPSGQWGIEEGYAFLWQAMVREQKPDIVAVARPHRLTWAGETVTLDGSKSWARSGGITRYEWTFSDGTTATGRTVEHTYDRPGAYSEILKVTDRQGRIDYDFACVLVLDRAHPDRLPPTVHAAYAPTTGIKAGDPVTFKVRTFRTQHGHETWDFGDGTPPVEAHSDGNANQHAKDGYAVTQHRFEKPGHYLVRVSRSNDNGESGTARLHVIVSERAAR